MELKEKIQEFVESMKGKAMMPHDKIIYMFELYSTAYQTRMGPEHAHCTDCVCRAYSGLTEYLKSH